MRRFACRPALESVEIDRMAERSAVEPGVDLHEWKARRQLLAGNRAEAVVFIEPLDRKKLGRGSEKRVSYAVFAAPGKQRFQQFCGHAVRRFRDGRP